MLIFGIDVPLLEIILVFAIILFILLIEAIIIIGLLVKHLNKSKNVVDLVEKMSETILLIKKAEVDQLDKLKRK
jgi:hypothetical protein